MTLVSLGLHSLLVEGPRIRKFEKFAFILLTNELVNFQFIVLLVANCGMNSKLYFTEKEMMSLESVGEVKW